MLNLVFIFFAADILFCLETNDSGGVGVFACA